MSIILHAIYTASSRIAASLVLRHSAPHFQPNSGDIVGVLSNETQHRAIHRHQSEEIGNIYYKHVIIKCVVSFNVIILSYNKKKIL